MSRLVWVTNFANPFSPDYQTNTSPGESHRDAVENDQRIWNALIKGRPKATSAFSVGELEAMGMHGLYKRVES